MSRFDKKAFKSRELSNLLKLKILVEIGKPSIHVTIGIENVFGVVGNDEMKFLDHKKYVPNQ